MDLLDNIKTNGSGEHRRKGERGGSLCVCAGQLPSHTTMHSANIPPDEERTLTVGREAILEDDLEGLDVAGDAVGFVDLTK